MLNSDLPLVYWDACVPLEYINKSDVARVSNIEGLMRDTSIQLVTSILSIVEVAKAKFEQDGRVLDPAIEAEINKLWDVDSPIELVEFYELIADDAKSLMRAAVPLGYSLKPADAIHLATADRLKVSEFHTYDNLGKYQALTKTKFPIGEPKTRQPVLVIPPIEENPLVRTNADRSA